MNHFKNHPVEKKALNFGTINALLNVRFYGQNQRMWRKNDVRRFVKIGKTIIYD